MEKRADEGTNRRGSRQGMHLILLLLSKVNHACTKEAHGLVSSSPSELRKAGPINSDWYAADGSTWQACRQNDTTEVHLPSSAATTT